MNIAILIAGVLSLLAFVVHAFMGDKEHQRLKPDILSNDKIQEIWIQGRAAWHWLSVDLLLSGILLIIISTTELIEAKSEISFLLALYFLICGLVWFGALYFSKQKNQQFLSLGQWIFCFVMSGLIYFGAG